MPSGRWNGPEKRRSTVRDARAGFGTSGTCVGIALCVRGPESRVGAAGSPGGWSVPVSGAAEAMGVLVTEGAGLHGKVFSSKYTSEAPGVARLRPRFMPTQARGSMRAFEYASRGLTANALHPKGSIGMMRGFTPVSDS
eukprot:3871582-Pleurochrysis_carterae.AAC.2